MISPKATALLNKFTAAEIAERCVEAELDASVRQTGICEWWRNENNDVWMTSCSNLWVFTNDGPKENDCNYCMYCGGVLKEGDDVEN